MWKWIKYEEDGDIEYSPEKYPTVRLQYSVIPGYWWECIAGDLEFSFEGRPTGFKRIDSYACCFEPTDKELTRAQTIAQDLIKQYYMLKSVEVCDEGIRELEVCDTPSVDRLEALSRDLADLNVHEVSITVGNAFRVKLVTTTGIHTMGVVKPDLATAFDTACEELKTCRNKLKENDREKAFHNAMTRDNPRCKDYAQLLFRLHNCMEVSYPAVIFDPSEGLILEWRSKNYKLKVYHDMTWRGFETGREEMGVITKKASPQFMCWLCKIMDEGWGIYRG